MNCFPYEEFYTTTEPKSTRTIVQLVGGKKLSLPGNWNFAKVLEEIKSLLDDYFSRNPGDAPKVAS